MTRLPVLTIRQAIRSLRAQLAADSARLCASPGHACADYSPDADFVCRHHLRRADTGARACVLGLVEDGPLTDTQIGAVLGMTRQGAAQLADRTEKKLGPRAALLRLRDALDTDPFAATRKPLEPSEDEDPPMLPTGPRTAAVLAALADGLTRPSDIGRRVRMDNNDVSSLLCHLARRGMVRRVSRGVWLPVQYAKESA